MHRFTEQSINNIHRISYYEHKSNNNPIIKNILSSYRDYFGKASLTLKYVK